LPESRHRYLYERLGDHDFQQLVSALLAFGWLERRPVTGDTTDAELAAVNRLRVPVSPTEREDGFGSGDQTTLPSLLSVARAERWLKVDAAAAYR
jgi:hypothetical protein